MASQNVNLVARSCCFAITLLLASTSSAGALAQSVTDERFAGILTVFEYASFQTTEGEIYSIRVENEEAQRLIAEKVRESDKSEPLCLRIAFSGQLQAEEDFVGRQVVAIKQLENMEITDCQNQT